MVQAQGFTIADDGSLLPPEDLPTCAAPKRIPPRLIPRCPVCGNTPGIIKYPFWQMTAANKRAVYVCINRGEATCPRDIAERSVLIDADIAAVLRHASQETPAARANPAASQVGRGGHYAGHV